ncbi:neuroligin 2 [Musca autumnalis]|uniref:neuroligin 2 n=1 Tax=Musca autumnalis TaxID=221902 RepID=UPI003CF0903C
MSKKQYNSSENEKRDQYRTATTTKTNTTLHNQPSVQRSNEMSKTKNQNINSQKNETENQTQKEIALLGKKPESTTTTRTNSFIHKLSLWLYLEIYFTLLQHFHHLQRQYECIIKSLNLLNQKIKTKQLNNGLAIIIHCRWLTIISVANFIQISISKYYTQFLQNIQYKLNLSELLIQVRWILGICPIRLIKVTTLQQIPKNQNRETTTTTGKKKPHVMEVILRRNTQIICNFRELEVMPRETYSKKLLSEVTSILENPLNFDDHLVKLKKLQMTSTDHKSSQLTPLNKLVENTNDPTTKYFPSFNTSGQRKKNSKSKCLMSRKMKSVIKYIFKTKVEEKPPNTLMRPSSQKSIITKKGKMSGFHVRIKLRYTLHSDYDNSVNLPPYTLIFNKYPCHVKTNWKLSSKTISHHLKCIGINREEIDVVFFTVKSTTPCFKISTTQNFCRTGKNKLSTCKAKTHLQIPNKQLYSKEPSHFEVNKTLVASNQINKIRFIIGAKKLLLLSSKLEHIKQLMIQWQHQELVVVLAKFAKVSLLAEEQHTCSKEKTCENLAVKRIHLKTLACCSMDSISIHKINEENKTEDQTKYRAFSTTTATAKEHEVIQLPSQHYDNNKYYLVCKQLLLLNEHTNIEAKYRQQNRATPPLSSLHHQESKCQYILSIPCFWQRYGYPLVLQKRIFKYLTKLTERTKTTVNSNNNNSSSNEEQSNTNSIVPSHLDDNGCDNEGLQQSGSNVLPQRISQVSKSDTATTTTTTTMTTSAVFYNTNSKTNKSPRSFNAKAGTLHFPTSNSAYAANIPSSNLQVSATLSNTLKPTKKTRQMASSLSSLTSELPHFKHCHHSNFHLKLSNNNTLISSLVLPRHTTPLSFLSSASSLSSSSSTSSLPSSSRTPILLLFFLLLLSTMWHTSEAFHGSVKLSTNTIKTKFGLVRGIVVRSSPLVEAYLGIPYASPPVGSLRFMPPITPSTWKTVRNADRFSPVCPQTVPIPPNGPEALLEVPRARLAQLRRLLPLLSNQSEDCLYLNIYVPYENRRQKRFATNSGESSEQSLLPTVLFIHGESYEWNSGNPYDGSELAAHGNVIVVTINFRLGIFGFLKTGGKESAQGNFGLMDLVAGLHWLKENLPAFGGDPQAITLLGHGTGAALANILAVSPVASDLIQHVALVSGSALSPWAIQKNPLFVKRRVAEQTGCHGDMLYDDLAPCLRTKSVAELLAVKIDHPRFLVGFAPFIDGTVISPNTDSIGKLSLPIGSAIVSTSGIEYANFPKRNLIFCLTSVESHLDLSAQDLEFGFNETRRDRILRTYVRNNFHYHLNEIFAVLKNEYTDWEKAIRSPLSSRDATLQFLSDGHTASSLIKLGYMHSLRGGKGYFLHFKHRTVEEEYPQRTGSVRGEDVPFWLGLPISPLFPHNYTTQERQISRLMLRYLANFAKTGNPNQSSHSSPLASKLVDLPPTSLTSAAFSAEIHTKHKRSSLPKAISSPVNTSSSSLTSSLSSNSSHNSRNTTIEDVAAAAAREALNLAVLYNQRRTKRTYFKRHSRSNSDEQHNGNGSGSREVGNFLSSAGNLDGDEMPFWDAYDVVNQLYMELDS